MGDSGLNEHDDSRRNPGARAQGWQGAHGATAAGGVPPPPGVTSRAHKERNRRLIAGLIGALVATVLSLIFVIAFVGGLHNPGPRSVPAGVVGPPTAASRLGSALDHAIPGGFVVTSYPSQTAALQAINSRTIDVALVPGPHAQHLLVAEAVSASLTNQIIKGATEAAARARVPLAVTDVRPLHSSDPDGLSQVYFVIALLAPSFLFGNQLASRIAPGLGPHWHFVLLAVYAAIVSAVAVAIADGLIGALTGAPWGLFGIGALFAFAVAVIGAAAARWAGGIGVALFGLLFIPVGIASSGVTLGPNMITPWYADLGKALPPASALPAVLNTTYFNANAITAPLLVLSAWALAGILALVLAAILHPPVPGQQPPAEQATDAAARRMTSTHGANA